MPAPATPVTALPFRSPIPEPPTLEATLSAFVRAWNLNDAVALAGLHAEDATLVTAAGARAQGRTAIARLYADSFCEALRGTTTTVRVARIRPLDGPHIIIDAAQTVRRADGGILLVTQLVVLFRRSGGRWLFLDARPYACVPEPDGSPSR